MKVIYFYHIPKCGGTYVRTLLDKFAKLEKGKSILFRIAGTDKVDRQTDQQFIDYLQNLHKTAKNRTICISHHHGYPGLSDIGDLLLETKNRVKLAGGEMVLFTVIREPIAFNISRVSYLQDKGYSFNRVFDNREDQNYMCKYLLLNHWRRWAGTKINLDLGSISKALNIFDYTFTTENMQLVKLFLNAFFETKNINIKKKINKGKIKMIPTESQLQRLISLNTMDFKLYEMVLSKEATYTFAKLNKTPLLNKMRSLINNNK